MVEASLIIPPADETDREGAQRVFEEFFILYQPTLIRLECKLHDIVENTEAAYADAYKPWHKALHDLVRGVHLMAKRLPLPDANGFIDALRMFSFEGAAKLLNDLSVSCKLSFSPDWVERFREHIKLLLVALSILNRGKQLQMSPAL